MMNDQKHLIRCTDNRFDSGSGEVALFWIKTSDTGLNSALRVYKFDRGKKQGMGDIFGTAGGRHHSTGHGQHADTAPGTL